MALEIVHYPHPALSWKSQPVVAIDADLRSTVRNMFDLMYEAQGIGLAANQVAIPFRVFVLNLTSDPEEANEEHVFVNPVIVQRNGSEEGEEGCLSLPELYGTVRRAEEIVVEAFDLQGQGFEMALTDLSARAVQHETDHLDGVLFIDRMSETKRRELEPQLTDFEQHYRRQQQAGDMPSDEDIKSQLRDWGSRDNANS